MTRLVVAERSAGNCGAALECGVSQTPLTSCDTELVCVPWLVIGYRCCAYGAGATCTAVESNDWGRVEW